MKREKPWVVIELKERGNVEQLAAQEEREKISPSTDCVAGEERYSPLGPRSLRCLPHRPT